MGSITLVSMRKLQQLGDWAMWLVIVGLLSLGFGILALVGLLALARALVFERWHEANTTDDEGATSTGDVGRASGHCVITQ